MKILFCPCHYVFDDGERGSELSWAYQIADGISQRNTESVVVTGFKNISSTKNYRIVELQRKYTTINLGLVNSLKFNLQYSLYIFSILRNENFHIIHHVLPFSIDRTFNLSLALVGQKKLKKIIGPIQSPLPFFSDNIHDVHSRNSQIVNFISSFFTGILHPLLSYLSYKTLQSADKIIVVNKATQRMLIERKISPEKITIINPGVDSNKFPFTKHKKRESDSLQLMSVGSLIKRKGFDLLIQMMREIVKKEKNISLRIIGDGPQLKDLKQMVKNYSLEENIIFVGHISHHEISSFYKRAHLFVSMSRSESWGQMYLEAMSSGLPVISSKNTGSLDIVKDGKSGYLVEQEDYKTAAQKVLYLAKNQAIMEKLSLSGRREVMKRYDWKKVIIPKYLEVYNEILNVRNN